MTAAPLTIAAREKDDVSLSLDAFVRSIGVRRAASHALFLGAGASVSSGIPSAQSCIWEWKRDLFLTNNPGLEEQFTELSLPSVQRRIQQWLDAQGTYPREGADDEYGFYIRACFPIADDRRAFFQEKVRGVSGVSRRRLLRWRSGARRWSEPQVRSASGQDRAWSCRGRTGRRQLARAGSQKPCSGLSRRRY